MSLDGSEAFFYSSLTNTQGVDSQYVDLGGVSGILKGVNDQIQGGSTTDDLPEGKVNLYFTNSRAQGAFTAGTGIIIATGTISNTGVLSLTGTNNRISVSGSTGNITLNLPQDINTTSSPQFAGLTLGTLSGVLKATAGVIANNATTDDLTEGKTNLYFTDARARGAFSAGTGISIASGVITNTAPATITSITGTANQIIVSGTSAITLSTPQDIGTGSSPQFARLINSSIGTSNLLLGTSAGNSITTSTGIVAIGESALSLLTTGIQCTAIGYQALRDTTGNNNTAVGHRAGRSITTGFQNTLLGSNAGREMTTGNYNSLFGMSAGFNISSGNTNFCLGLNAGYSITTSSDNISIGAYTMAKNLNPITVTNGRNVAIGHYASHSLEGTPANNISIGYQSLYNATSCSDNICIGTNAGNSITTGGGNIAIGGSSLSTGGTLTAGQGNNIGIGIASNLYVSAGATNNIGIGAYSNFNTSTGVSNISIGPYTQASSATGNNQITISTNGTSVTPITGLGDNTAFIDARSGLYKYMPAYGFFRSNNNISNSIHWLTPLLSQNITVSGKTVTFALAGLYEATFSGTIQSVALGPTTGQLYVNGLQYPSSTYAFYYGAHGGAGTTQALSFTIIYRFSAGGTMFMNTVNAQGNGFLPVYLSIKYLGL